MINNLGRPQSAVKDSLFTENTTLENWGKTTVNENLNTAIKATKLISNSSFDNIESLTEGSAISATYTQVSVDANSTMQAEKTGGLQTLSSGIWTASGDFKMKADIKGVSANSAKLGFYKVDNLTGAIKTDAGLVEASSNEAYKAAVLDNLVSTSLTSLVGKNKSGSAELNLKENDYFAAVLFTTNASGVERSLYSISSANPSQSIQFLNLGNNTFGFEDLLLGIDSGFDGDFNDVTFNLA